MDFIVSRSGGREGVSNTVGNGQGSKDGRIPRVREGLVIECKIWMSFTMDLGLSMQSDNFRRVVREIHSLPESNQE